MATLRSTLDPSICLVKKCAQEEGKEIEIVELLADGAFNKSQDELEALLCNLARHYKNDVDAIILAQASMSFCEEKINQTIEKPVYSSPRYGVQAVANIAEAIDTK